MKLKTVLGIVLALAVLYTSLWIVHAGAIPDVSDTADEYTTDELPRWASNELNGIEIGSFTEQKSFSDGTLYQNSEGDTLYESDSFTRYQTDGGYEIFGTDGRVTECKSILDDDDYDEAYKLLRFSNGLLSTLFIYKDGVIAYYGTDGKLLAVKTECTGSPDWLCKLSFCRQNTYYNSKFDKISQAEFEKLI